MDIQHLGVEYTKSTSTNIGVWSKKRSVALILLHMHIAHFFKHPQQSYSLLLHQKLGNFFDSTSAPTSAYIFAFLPAAILAALLAASPATHFLS